MNKPIVVVNFKTYESAQGISAENLAKIMSGIHTSARLVAAVSSFDLSSVVCACAADISEAKILCSFNPTFVAVEPPELIGGDVSVTNVDPAIVSGTVEAVKKISKVGVLCGAGIKNGKDVIKAIELGSRGVLLASGVTKSDNPEATLMDLISLID